MDCMSTIYRISSSSKRWGNKLVYEGTVRYYEKLFNGSNKFLFTERSGIKRLTAVDAQLDAYRCMYDRLYGSIV